MIHFNQQMSSKRILLIIIDAKQEVNKYNTGPSFSPGSVFKENALSFKVHEQFTPTKVLEDEVELAACLESVYQVHYEWVLQQSENIVSI